MTSVRPLRELLADLAGDAGARAGGAQAYLAGHGYPDLPADLVAEAVVSYADTAPPEVAEQLAPFVTAHTAGDEEPADWFELLSSAEVDHDPDALDDDPVSWAGDDLGDDPGPGLDFGAGAVDGPDLAADLDDDAPADDGGSHTDWVDAEEHVPTHSAPALADDFVEFDDEDDESDEDADD